MAITVRNHLGQPRARVNVGADTARRLLDSGMVSLCDDGILYPAVDPFDTAQWLIHDYWCCHRWIGPTYLHADLLRCAIAQ